MNDKKEKMDENETETQPEPQNYKTHFYIALGAFIASAVLLILAIVFTFAVKNGTAFYFLIASMIASLAAVSFLNAMKQRGGDGKLRTVFVILSYAVMIVSFAIFIAGTVASGVAK